MINVVEVIPTLAMGGAESMLRDYCMLMDKKRFQLTVIVLTEHKHTPIEEALEKEGIRVTYIGELLFGERTLGLPARIIRRISRYILFRKTLLNLSPDVIHLHLQIGRYMRFVPLNKLHSRMFLTVHNVSGKYFSTDKKDRKKYTEYKEVYRLVHDYDMHLIALHDGLNAELRELFDTDRVITVNNGIMMERFLPDLYDKNEERRKLGISDSSVVIGHVGSMHPQKNHDLIIRVFEEFHRIYDDSVLLLIGNGELKNSITDRIRQKNLEKSVIILSDRTDVPQLMRTMDVFFFPSKWEGFGNVLIEAQCMDLPCVVSEVVTDAVRITDKVHVLRLNDDIAKWVDEINSIVKGNKTGLPALKNKECYDMVNSVKSLEKLYEEAV